MIDRYGAERFPLWLSFGGGIVYNHICAIHAADRSLSLHTLGKQVCLTGLLCPELPLKLLEDHPRLLTQVSPSFS